MSPFYQQFFDASSAESWSNHFLPICTATSMPGYISAVSSKLVCMSLKSSSMQSSSLPCYAEMRISWGDLSFHWSPEKIWLIWLARQMFLMHSHDPRCALPKAAKINWRERLSQMQELCFHWLKTQLRSFARPCGFPDSWVQNYLIDHALINLCCSQESSTVSSCSQSNTLTT